MSKNAKVVKEYDVKGKHPFSEVFDERRRNKKWYEKVKSWFSVRWYAIKLRYYDTKIYVNNLIRFNKMMKDWYPWDGESQLKLFAYGLELLANHIERHGMEIESPRKKKVASIRRLVELLRTDYEDEVNDKYLGKGEEEVITHVTEYEDGSTGFEVKDEKSKEIQQKSWDVYQIEHRKTREAWYEEVFRLIKGQDSYELLDKVKAEIGEKKEDETHEEYQKRFDKVYYELFDGSGIEGWWD